MSNYKPHPLAGSPLVDYVARALADLGGYSRWSDLDERGREVRVRNAARLLDGVGTWAAWHDHDDLKDALARLLDCDTTLWDDDYAAAGRGDCSVVHATLDDDALVGELVRRGVLEVDEYAEPCGWRCDVVTYDYDECRHDCRLSGPHAEHECVNGHTVAVGPDDAQPERTLRYVTAWEPDTRTAQQRSDDAIDELRRRLKEDA